MWTEQETKRYEEHLKKHWTRDGQYIPPPLRPSVMFDSDEMRETISWVKGHIQTLRNEQSPLLDMLHNNV